MSAVLLLIGLVACAAAQPAPPSWPSTFTCATDPSFFFSVILTAPSIKFATGAVGGKLYYDWKVQVRASDPVREL